MPAAKQEDRIPVASAVELAAHFESIEYALAQKETEDSWERLDKALSKLEAVTKGGGYKFDEFIGHMKAIVGPVTRSLLSERTRLSGTAADVLNSIAPRLGERFDPLVSLYVPPLLLICARTNKVAFKRAEKCLHMIAKHCKLPSTLTLLKEACKDKVANLRFVAVTTVTLLLQHAGKDKLNRRVVDLETIIHITATDSNAEVRHSSKRLFEKYVTMWPDRVGSFTINMTPTIRRYLSLPKTGAFKPDPALFSQPAMAISAESSSASDDGATERSPCPKKVKTCAKTVVESAHPASEANVHFLQQLAAAKNKSKAHAYIQTTGVLKSLSSGGSKQNDPGRSQPMRLGPEVQQQQPTIRRMAASRIIEATSTGERGSRAIHPTASREKGQNMGSSSDAVASHLGHKEVEDDHTRFPASCVDVSSAKKHEQFKQIIGETSTRGHNHQRDPSAQAEDLAPSDGVARRLASMAQESHVRQPRFANEELPVSQDGTCRNGMGIAGTKASSLRLGKAPGASAPKAVRVTVSAASTPTVSRQPSKPAQSQVAAIRQQANAAISKESSQIGARSSQPESTTTHDDGKTGGKLCSTGKGLQSFASTKTEIKRIASPKKASSIKTTGKVVSSTTQSLAVKSKAVNVSAAAKKAAAMRAQAAREAIVAKKQAEVAQLRAQAKARSEQAALHAAESQALVQAKTKQLREASHHSHPPAPLYVVKPCDVREAVSSQDTLENIQSSTTTSPIPAAKALATPSKEVDEGSPRRVGDMNASLRCATSAHSPSMLPSESDCRQTATCDPSSDRLASEQPEKAESQQALVEDGHIDIQTFPATPFRRCRRPNGALDSPADKIRRQLDGLAAANPQNAGQQIPSQCFPNVAQTSPLRATPFARRLVNQKLNTSPVHHAVKVGQQAKSPLTSSPGPKQVFGIEKENQAY